MKDVSQVEQALNLELSKIDFSKIDTDTSAKIEKAKVACLDQFAKYKQSIQDLMDAHNKRAHRLKENLDSIPSEMLEIERAKALTKLEHSENLVQKQIKLEYELVELRFENLERLLQAAISHIEYKKSLNQVPSNIPKIAPIKQQEETIKSQEETIRLLPEAIKPPSASVSTVNASFVFKILSSPMAKTFFIGLLLASIAALGIIAITTGTIPVVTGLALATVGIFSGAALLIGKSDVPFSPNPALAR